VKIARTSIAQEEVHSRVSFIMPEGGTHVRRMSTRLGSGIASKSAVVFGLVEKGPRLRLG
jgi:hypothetical protein